MKKTKNTLLPNECSGLRWTAAVMVGLLIGYTVSSPLTLLIYLREVELRNITFFEIPLLSLANMLVFVFMFWAVVLALRWIAKTPLKAFVLGVGGRVNIKECLILMGLQTLGITVTFAFSFSNISFRGVDAGSFAVLVVAMLLLTWMQTTFEELVFRGIFLRWACKNKLGYTKMALAGLILSAVLFGLMHLDNPELSNMTGFEMVIGCCCYILPGVVLYWADLQLGSLMPGIVIHWIHNFLLFTVIAEEVTAMPLPTLLVDKSETDAIGMLPSTLMVYLPVILYLTWRTWKSKKEAACETPAE